MHVAYVPDLLRFEYSKDAFLDFDIIDSQLKIEAITTETGSDLKVDVPAVTSRIQEWIQTDHEVSISVTQAYSLWSAILTAFQTHKKKLVHTLTSASVTASTPSPSILNN